MGKTVTDFRYCRSHVMCVRDTDTGATITAWLKKYSDMGATKENNISHKSPTFYLEATALFP